jgi:hypothetical protein
MVLDGWDDAAGKEKGQQHVRKKAGSCSQFKAKTGCRQQPAAIGSQQMNMIKVPTTN